MNAFTSSRTSYSTTKLLSLIDALYLTVIESIVLFLNKVSLIIMNAFTSSRTFEVDVSEVSKFVIGSAVDITFSQFVHTQMV